MKNQYQYIEHLPSLSEKDIDQYKDFKKILDRRTEQLQKKIERRNKFLKGGLSVALIGFIAIGLTYWEITPFQKDEIIVVDINDVNTAISKNNTQKLDVPKAKSPREIDSKQNLTSHLPSKSKEQPIKKDSKKGKKLSLNSDKPSFTMGYQRALPIVGMDSLSNYLNQNLKYPEDVDKNEGISGTVNVIFTITEEGNTSYIQIQNSLGKPFDEECKRLISNMPKWKPAIRNGQAVDSKVSLQLSFKIDQ